MKVRGVTERQRESGKNGRKEEERAGRRGAAGTLPDRKCVLFRPAQY